MILNKKSLICGIFIARAYLRKIRNDHRSSETAKLLNEKDKMEGDRGFEPRTTGSGDQCSIP